MTVTRVVPDLEAVDLPAVRAFYTTVLGLEVVMDQGWIVTLADPADPSVQVSLMTHDATAPCVPALSVELAGPDEVDAAHAAAVAAGQDVVHPLTDEPWGVRRFFVRDPAGHVVNVLAHRR